MRALLIILLIFLLVGGGSFTYNAFGPGYGISLGSLLLLILILVIFGII